MSPYRTITGRRIDLTTLSSAEKDLFTALLEEHRTNPDWAVFSRFWQELLKHVLLKVSAPERTDHPLYRIAQDLEMRLGIAQGKVAEPDYRDYLADRIDERFGSRYRFCKETGIAQAFLSQVLSGKKEFSLETLRRAANALGLGLALLPTGDVAGLPISDDWALARVSAMVSTELASLESLRDHLGRIEEPAKRQRALPNELSMFDGALEQVRRELAKLREGECGERILEIIDEKTSELESVLGFLHARIGLVAGALRTPNARGDRPLSVL